MMAFYLTEWEDIAGDRNAFYGYVWPELMKQRHFSDAVHGGRILHDSG